MDIRLQIVLNTEVKRKFQEISILLFNLFFWIKKNIKIKVQKTFKNTRFLEK